MKFIFSLLVTCSALCAHKGLIPTENILDELSKTEDLTIVYCYGTSCRYCNIFKPKLEKAISQTGAKVFAVNVKNQIKFKNYFKIRSWPTILLIKNFRILQGGRVQDSSMPIEKLIKVLSKK